MASEGRSRNGIEETEVIRYDRSSVVKGKHDMLDSSSLLLSVAGGGGDTVSVEVMVVET